ncbi:hypothetical protein F0Q45_21835 [Mycobacterium simiae]|uniref:Uncharacterized protein n=1 Tax=Mycobacterium simiae TaxID=1784 RepID=A0A5B1BHU5_MYCSI|nr:hypothetical protein [Mycobacterium simiae]KAA1248217.1 hypothetical protein F0Q45_21835 [Mycobacterium simiae]
MDVDSGRDALRAHVRMRLAFWQAQDRRSITTGPGWLWRGQHVASLRQADLSAPTGELIARRRAAGMPTADLFGAAGPRERRLPRWASARSAAGWSGATVMLVLVALICARAGDDRAGIGVLAGWAAAASAAVTLAVTGLLVWARRDPLRLSAAQVGEVNTARRVLDWNPLAGAGPITSGGAYLLEGIAVVADLVGSPAWALPGVDVLRWRFDPDEEIFQIARAAYCLDVHETATATGDQLVAIEGFTGTMVRAERRYLTDALLNRLLVLHRCVATMNDLQQRARQAGAEGIEPASSALLGSAAENELAAAALGDLNTDLLTMAHVYANVGAPGGNLHTR